MLLLPPWTQHCSKHHLLLLALASPLGDEKNHDESTVKAISFSALYPKNLFLSAACSLFLLPWHTSGCPNMNNVSKTYWSQGIIFTPSYSGEKLLLSGDCPCPSPVFMQHGNSSEQTLKSKPSCCPSTILAFPLQGERTAIPYGLTRGREMPHAELDDEQCGSSMTPGNSVSTQLSRCRNEKFIILFPFLLLEPWSSGKLVLLRTLDDLWWQKWSKLPLKGYNC